MYVNVAVLKETRKHERRVALVPSVAVRLNRLGAKLHMQPGAGEGAKLDDGAYKDVVIVDDLKALLGDADVAARTEKSSPIFGMPILNADQAKQVYVIKRGDGKGYAGVINQLFYADNCGMVYGDASAVLTEMIEAVRGLSSKAA